MKRRVIICLLVLCLVLAFPLTALAQSTRACVITPGLTFSGTTAKCYVLVSDVGASDIDVVMKLWQGNTCKRTWRGSGTTYVELDKEITVEHNVTYTLTVDATVDGVQLSRVSKTKTCP